GRINLKRQTSGFKFKRLDVKRLKLITAGEDAVVVHTPWQQARACIAVFVSPAAEAARLLSFYGCCVRLFFAPRLILRPLLTLLL
ncbi:MAG: hypothetical protein RSD62_09810, partial [Ruthenibacterium sp.]